MSVKIFTILQNISLAEVKNFLIFFFTYLTLSQLVNYFWHMLKMYICNYINDVAFPKFLLKFCHNKSLCNFTTPSWLIHPGDLKTHTCNLLKRSQ